MVNRFSAIWATFERFIFHFVNALGAKVIWLIAASKLKLTYNKTNKIVKNHLKETKDHLN